MELQHVRVYLAHRHFKGFWAMPPSVVEKTTLFGVYDAVGLVSAHRTHAPRHKLRMHHASSLHGRKCLTPTITNQSGLVFAMSTILTIP